MSKANPYRPPAAVSCDVPEFGSVPPEVELRFNEKFLREAMKRYLLWKHAMVLTIFSIISVVGGCMLTIWLDHQGILPFLVGQVALAGIVAVIYQAIVHGSQHQSKQQLTEHGLVANAIVKTHIDASKKEIVLQSSAGEYRWKLEQTRVFQWRNGLIACVAPMMFIPIARRDVNTSYGDFTLFRRNFMEHVRGSQH